MNKYSEQQMEDENNIDKSFKKIHDNLWAGNYIGFNDSSHMNEFNKVDLHENYFTIFPNLAANIFCYINIIAFIPLIAISIIRLCHEDQPNEEYKRAEAWCSKLNVIIPYLIFFIGFFSYIVYEYFNIYKNRNPENFTKIKTDPFLEDLLKTIKDRHPKEEYIFSLMICYSGSMAIFILAWILSYIFTRRYMRLMNMTGGKGTKTLKSDFPDEE